MTLRGLYIVTPDQADTGALLDAVAQVLPARPAIVQYRSKLVDADLRRLQAVQLLALCRQSGIPLVINDDLYRNPRDRTQDEKRAWAAQFEKQS